MVWPAVLYQVLTLVQPFMRAIYPNIFQNQVDLVSAVALEAAGITKSESSRSSSAFT